MVPLPSRFELAETHFVCVCMNSMEEGGFEFEGEEEGERAGYL